MKFLSPLVTIKKQLAESTYKVLSFSLWALWLAYEDMWRTVGKFLPYRHTM